LGLATLDLSQASDNIAYWLVYLLFPRKWFDLLELSRSDRIKIDGERRELEKFSSMGNGVTFAIETVIFLAVCLACVPRGSHQLVTVYGDDIICPQAYARDVVGALEFLGFSVNQKKSFLAGRFFESCGTDWFEGQNVRPFYLKEQTDTSDKTGAPYVLQVANALRLYSQRTSPSGHCDPRWFGLWQALAELVPAPWGDHYIPHQLGDTGLICSLEEAKALGKVRRPQKKIPINGKRAKWVDSGEEGYMVKHIACAPVYRWKYSLGTLYLRLDLLSRMEDGFAVDQEARTATDPLHRRSLMQLAEMLVNERVQRNHAPDWIRPGLQFDGREPKRGYLGRPVSKWVLASSWDQRLSWSTFG
jgi:hypothetical protein